MSDTNTMSIRASETRLRLIGKRARIQVSRRQCSARALNGLTGTIIALHPLVLDWVKIQLDVNPITPHDEWSVPIEQLELI
jgi:hypothetical protein